MPESIQLLESLDKEDRNLDLLLIQTLFAIKKLSQHFPDGLHNPDYVELTDDLWTRVTSVDTRYIDIVAGLAIDDQGHIVAVDSVSPTGSSSKKSNMSV